MDVAWGAVVIDAEDPAGVAAFWGLLLDRPWRALDGERAGWFQIAPTAPGGPGLTIQPVVDRPAGPASLHLDLWVDDIEAAIARVVALGGRRGDHSETLARGRIQTAHDVEGHVFCLLAPPRGEEDD
ncbi:MAG TPA: VOC family protein [Iamia sp.]|nr:VOC family protein [Iamia sp.]